MNEYELKRRPRRVVMPDQSELVDKLGEALPPGSDYQETLFYARFIREVAGEKASGRTLLYAWTRSLFQAIDNPGSLLPAEARGRLRSQFDKVIMAITPDPAVASDAIGEMNKIRERQPNRRLRKIALNPRG